MNQIKIFFENNENLKIHLNESDVFDIISYDKKVHAWKTANDKLEQDVLNTAEVYKDFELGEFLWCITYDNHRNDGLAGTIYYYYVIEIIKVIIAEQAIHIIQIQNTLPDKFIKYIKNSFDIPLKITGSVFDKNYIKKIAYPFLSPLKFLPHFVTNNLFKKHALKKSGVFIQMRDDFKKNRYSNILNCFDKNDIIVYNKFIFQNPIKHPFGNNEIYFREFLGIGIVRQTIKSVNKIKDEIKRKTKKVKSQNLFYDLVSDQSYFQFAHLVLKKMLFQKAIEKYKPKVLISVTSLADPISRLPLSVCYENKIPSIVVICRSMLSKLRAEDRCCEADLKNYNKTHIGDYFIVRDKYSKNTLVEQGVPENVIFLNNNNGKTQNNLEGDKTTYEINNGIVLLLTQFDYNQKIIEIISNLKLGRFETIYLRSHPNRWKKNEVNNYQMELLISTNLKIVDITDIPMKQLIGKNSIAITSNSTSGVEIVSTGIPILWLPFITEQSIQFADVMSKIGKSFSNVESFKSYFEKLNTGENEVQNLIKETKIEYENDFYENDNMEQLINRFI